MRYVAMLLIESSTRTSTGGSFVKRSPLDRYIKLLRGALLDTKSRLPQANEVSLRLKMTSVHALGVDVCLTSTWSLDSAPPWDTLHFFPVPIM